MYICLTYLIRHQPKTSERQPSLELISMPIAYFACHYTNHTLSPLTSSFLESTQKTLSLHHVVLTQCSLLSSSILPNCTKFVPVSLPLLLPPTNLHGLPHCKLLPPTSPSYSPLQEGWEGKWKHCIARPLLAHCDQAFKYSITCSLGCKPYCLLTLILPFFSLHSIVG